MVRTPVYLDHHATTPIDARVLAKLQEVQSQHFGNPASANHAFGWAAARIVEEARELVALLIGGTAREIVFTSGATESNNLALKGAAARYADKGRHLITTNLEHEAVTQPLAQLEQLGWEVTTVKTDGAGLIDPESIRAALTPRTVLVSVIAAQNEVGTVQPLEAISRVCREQDVLLHTDAAQAVGKIPLDVTGAGLAMLSLSGHKLYGPKGVGALFVRRRDPRVGLEPLFTGSSQERGLRAGTLNVPGIAALGEACRLAGLEMQTEAVRLGELRDRLLARLRAELPGVHLNGSSEHRLPGNLNVSFEGVMAHRLLSSLTVLAVSSSSACSSAESGVSPILAALGVPDDLARSSLRIGLGRQTTAEEIDFAAEKIIGAVQQLRRENPL